MIFKGFFLNKILRKSIVANNYHLGIVLGIIIVNMFMNLKILTYDYKTIFSP
jgi:hypothetical protein